MKLGLLEKCVHYESCYKSIWQQLHQRLTDSCVLLAQRSDTLSLLR